MLRRYTLKRIEPWSVLKFGSIVGIVLFVILTLTVAFVWSILSSFDLVNRGCDVALDVGFASCDITAAVVFRAAALIAGLIAVVHTAVLLFGTFLFNLIAELTGGIAVQLVTDDEVVKPAAKTDVSASAKSVQTKAQPSAPQQPPTRLNPPATPRGGIQRDELFD